MKDLERRAYLVKVEIRSDDSGRRGLQDIPVVASHGSASWIAEEGAVSDSDEAFSGLPWVRTR